MGIETTTTVTCDGCGEPIEIKPGYPHNYYLELSAADRGMELFGGGVFLVGMEPPMKDTKTFHSLMCLDQWRSQKESK